MGTPSKVKVKDHSALTSDEHTPGPWKAERKNKHSTMHVTAGHFRVFLGTHVGAPMKEWDANAALIASAPTLLAQNRELVEALEKACDTIAGDFCSHSGECSADKDTCYIQEYLALLAKVKS